MKVVSLLNLKQKGENAYSRTADRNNKQVILEEFALLTDFISEINDTQVDNAKDLFVVFFYTTELVSTKKKVN